MENSIKISVVLTTYNGMKYLEALLESLRCQTRRIDEVLICDDGSTDDTREYVAKYIEKYQLDNWILRLNKENYGWMKNFHKGMVHATGDIIFPCDQDDIWNTEKVERMTSVMEKYPDILLLASDYQPLYEDGGKKVDEFEQVSDKTIERVELDRKFALHKRPGCVMAVRKRLIELTDDIWSDSYPHDAFLWTSANVFDGCCYLHEPLIFYRRHDANASAGMQHNIQAQVNYMERTTTIVQWRNNRPEPFSEEKKKILDDYLQFAQLRIDLIQKKKIINWFKLAKYKKYYRSTRQRFGDIYYLFK